MIEIEAASFGPEILNVIDSREGRVVAVLRNGIYLESSEGYVVGVVGDDAADGPFTLRMRNLRLLLDPVRGRQDLRFKASQQHFEIGGTLTISLGGAQAWQPTMPGRLGNVAARTEAMNALAETISSSAPESSPGRALGPWLSGFVSSGHFNKARHWYFESHSTTAAKLASKRIADGAIDFIEAWHPGDVADAIDALIPLLGLGEGLTPSGDDLVSGILAALVWGARLGVMPAPAVEQATKHVNDASSRTNRISARLLYYACQGALYAPALQLGAALLAGDAEGLYEPALRLFAIGSTSGIDLATGLLVGCCAATTDLN
jgi:Protein of unknown function (DUF2877)